MWWLRSASDYSPGLRAFASAFPESQMKIITDLEALEVSPEDVTWTRCWIFWALLPTRHRPGYYVASASTPAASPEEAHLRALLSA